MKLIERSANDSESWRASTKCSVLERNICRNELQAEIMLGAEVVGDGTRNFIPGELL